MISDAAEWKRGGEHYMTCGDYSISRASVELKHQYTAWYSTLPVGTIGRASTHMPMMIGTAHTVQEARDIAQLHFNSQRKAA